MATRERKKLTLEQVETQMEVLTKEEMNALKGGFCIIEDPDGIVAQLKKHLLGKINNFQSLLLTASMSDEVRGAFESAIKEYQSALLEITQLEQAKETYHFSYGSDARTENRDGTIYSTVPKGNQDIGLVGHELKHMHQYYKGDLVRGSGNETHGYGIQDEVEAYRRQDAINAGPNFFIFQLQRTENDIRNMVDEKGSQPYKNL